MQNFLNSTFIPDTIFADTPEGQPVRIDFKTLVGEHTLVAAQTGYGKSILLRMTNERALASNHPLIVLDSDGGSASLREVAPNGLLVFGGKDGDPEISLDHAVGHLMQIVEARNSVVFDMSGLSDDEQAVIVSDVLETMLRLPEELHQPYLVVIDEVQRFAPQRGVTRATGPIIKVFKESRRLGVSVIVATQRIADVSKGFTTQTKNKILGHVSDAADRKRYAEELGLNRQAAARFSTFDKGEFLVRGEAFGGPLDKVMVRLPVSGKVGKDHLIARLQDPILPTDQVRARLLATATNGRARLADQHRRSPNELATTLPSTERASEDAPSATPLELLIIDILKSQGKSGTSKDVLALLAGTTERRKVFADALSNLLALKQVRMGTGTKVRLNGAAAETAGEAGATVAQRVADLRSQREAGDDRVLSCLSAAGHSVVEVQEIKARTGMGPRVLKAALQRLKRDGWIVERRGGFATTPALARLIGR